MFGLLKRCLFIVMYPFLTVWRCFRRLRRQTHHLLPMTVSDRAYGAADWTGWADTPVYDPTQPPRNVNEFYERRAAAAAAQISNDKTAADDDITATLFEDLQPVIKKSKVLVIRRNMTPDEGDSNFSPTNSRFALQSNFAIIPEPSMVDLNLGELNDFEDQPSWADSENAHWECEEDAADLHSALKEIRRKERQQRQLEHARKSELRKQLKQDHPHSVLSTKPVVNFDSSRNS